MKQAVLTLILNNPNIRTVEIADRLDLDPEQVRPLIAAELASGAIVEEPVKAPNGLTVHSFRYASSRPAPPAVDAAVVAATVPARIARTVKPGGSLADVLPNLVPASEIDVPVTRKVAAPVAVELAAPVVTVRADDQVCAPAAPGKTKVDIGIEYLFAQDGPVSNKALALAMGMPKSQHPTSYMAFAVKQGRVIYDKASKTWCKGVELVADVAPAVPALPVLPSVRAPLMVPKFLDAKATPQVEPAPDQRSEAAEVIEHGDKSNSAQLRAAGDDTQDSALYPASEIKITDFRTEPRDSAERFLAGVLSDGALHLRVPGKAPFDLPAEYARELYQFMQAHAYVSWPQQQAA